MLLPLPFVQGLGCMGDVLPKPWLLRMRELTLFYRDSSLSAWIRHPPWRCVRVR